MKLENIELGMRLKVKKNQQRFGYKHRWHITSEGLIGTVVDLSTANNDKVRVKLKLDDGSLEWGTHKGLRKLREGEE